MRANLHLIFPKLLMLVGLLWMSSAMAQGRVFENPQNLQVLPKNISPAELSATMRGFAGGLGLRCSSCHQGEEGQSLREYDFANDDKELKQTARLMIKMVASINQEHLADLGADRLTVQCMTCHRGIRKPRLITDILSEAYQEDGLTGMKQRYRELRDEYYGSHSYDFSERVLNQLGSQLAQGGVMNDGVAILKFNLDYYPQSAMTYFSLGELYRADQQTDAARAAYEKVIEINPTWWRANVDQRLRMLRPKQD